MSMEIKRLDLADAEYLIHCQHVAVEVRGQIGLLEQLATAHERGASQTLRLLAGPGEWKMTRDEGGYLLTHETTKEGHDASQI